MRKQLRWLLFPLGLALLLIGSFSQEGSALISQPEPTISPTFNFDRLTQPTLPANPSQADLGAQDYWLYCMVCHGDFGQGLTAEFRKLYPPEEQTCWQSGCHGERPYENGFTLPTAIPPVIGPSASMEKYANGSVLHAFVAAAMPWHLPGSLEADEYWRLTAFLLRENGYELPEERLGPENAAQISIGGQAAEFGSATELQATTHPTVVDSSQSMQERLTGNEQESPDTQPSKGAALQSLAALAVGGLVLGLLLWIGRRNRG